MSDFSHYHLPNYYFWVSFIMFHISLRKPNTYLGDIRSYGFFYVHRYCSHSTFSNIYPLKYSFEFWSPVIELSITPNAYTSKFWFLSNYSTVIICFIYGLRSSNIMLYFLVVRTVINI